METLILIAVLVLTQITKKYVYPKFGTTGVHALTFVISLVGYGIYAYAVSNPTFFSILEAGLNYLVSAVAIYEIILKKIGFKSITNK